MHVFGIKKPLPVLALLLGCIPATAQTAPPAPGTITPTATAPGTQQLTPLSKSQEFGSIAAAAAHCPGSAVVWSSLNKSHSFHISNSRYFGKTKHGAYLCKGDALAAGFHQAKS